MVRRRGSAIGWRTRLRHNDRKAIAKPEGGRKAALFFERPCDRNDDAAKYVSEPLSASPGRAPFAPAPDFLRRGTSFGWGGGRGAPPFG